eukprot:TRINITY_DN38409_c0_g1_i1.p1 TRINITY_DN38409_c0_g1~~TRINITY_DN38409_c0_g1_i1.p1  ORF type:complete len:163 (-),score=13.21 TRINITY_DN38409_c0_g1_i1:124-567(-)
MSDHPSWKNVFEWSIASNGSVIILACIVVGLSALSLALLGCCFWRTRYGHFVCSQLLPFNDDSVRLAARLPEEHAMSDTRLQPLDPFVMKEGRPDINDIVSQAAQEGKTLSVHACGPISLLDAVRTAVSRANTAGQKVTLKIEQAEW